MPFYDKGTGQSVFIGPGSYKAHEAASKLTAQPCPTMIKPIVLHEGKEPHEQHYIMIGEQIKYEPAWVLNDDQKKVMKELNTAGCTRTLAGFNRNTLLKTCKTVSQACETIKRSTTQT